MTATATPVPSAASLWHLAWRQLARDFRAGDVRHSQADIGKVQRLLGYAPTHRLAAGIAEAMPWYIGGK